MKRWLDIPTVPPDSTANLWGVRWSASWCMSTPDAGSRNRAPPISHAHRCLSETRRGIMWIAAPPPEAIASNYHGRRSWYTVFVMSIRRYSGVFRETFSGPLCCIGPMQSIKIRSNSIWKPSQHGVQSLTPIHMPPRDAVCTAVAWVRAALMCGLATSAMLHGERDVQLIVALLGRIMHATASTSSRACQIVRIS